MIRHKLFISDFFRQTRIDLWNSNYWNFSHGGPEHVQANKESWIKFNVVNISDSFEKLEISLQGLLKK